MCSFFNNGVRNIKSYETSSHYMQVGKRIAVLSIINIDSGIQAYFRVVMASQVMGASTSYFKTWTLKENTV